MLDLTGQQIGEYRLTRQLGSGTYGAVYQAEHSRHDWDVYQTEEMEAAGLPVTDQVAVKLFRTELTPELQPHFTREVRALQIPHPHIASVHTSGFVWNTPYIVMDLLPAGCLRQRYALGDRVPLAQVLGYVQQISEALQFAHERGIVHRDLKPQNILLRQNNEVVLSDFGIGALMHAAGPLTRFELAESVPYAAPELLQGQPQPASDQYALAVMAYEWLCGVRPFTGSQESIIAQHQSMPPASLRLYDPSLPAMVEAVILRALAKDPRARYASVRDFAQAFTQAVNPAIALAGQSHIGYSSPGYGASSMVGPIAQMQPSVTPVGFKLSPALVSTSGGIAMIGGAGLSIVGLILYRFAQAQSDAGVTLNVIGMFLVALGLLALVSRFVNKARTLAIAALIVFLTPMVGYTTVVLYWPSFMAQESIYVISTQEIFDISYVVLLVTTILLLLSFIGLIVAGFSTLHAAKQLPHGASIVGWGLIVSNSVLIVLQLLGLMNLLPDTPALSTVLANLSLIFHILILALLAALGYLLLTPISPPPPVQVNSQMA
jgi:hypothetical protein